MDARYAYVIGSDKNHNEIGTWCITVKDGETTKISSAEQGADISIVDDKIIATLSDGSVQRWNAELKKEADIWPITSEK